MPSQKLKFKNKAGESLVARLDLPVDSEVLAYALFAHCFTCSKDLKAVNNISRSLNQEGIAVLRFDFTGLGESAGDFADSNFSSNVDDLIAAAKFLEDSYQAPQILIGHSLGGAAVLMAASRLKSVRAIATIAAPAEPKHVSQLFDSSLDEIETEGEARVSLAGRQFKIKKQFIDDLEQTKMQNIIANLRPALIVFHSPVDNTVGVENAAAIFKAAKHPKSFVSLDNADHLLSRQKDSRYVGHIISAWASKYIDEKEQPSWWQDVQDNRVAVHLEQGFRAQMLANGFSLIADEPISVGGTNTGPTPYDYLAAALGACTAMTLRMYANRKKWPLDSVLVTVKHSKIHSQDINGKLDQFTRIIDISGELDNTQKQRLLEIADRCPVHRTLESDVAIETVIAGSS